MATRFFLPDSGAAAVSPAFDAAWERTADANRIKCVTTKIGSANLTKTVQEPTADETETLARQYVSDPLVGAQAISGTIKGQIRVREADAAANARAQLIVKVVSGDGSTVRGTLLAPDMSGTVANEFATTLTNRKFPKGWTGSGAALTTVNAQSGDRIVIEIGVHVHVNPIAADSYDFRFGDEHGASNLPEDETTTADDDPWIEFSQTLNFTGLAANIGTALEIETARGIIKRIGKATNTNTAMPVTKPPVNTVAPVITGTARVGSILDCATGSWTPTPSSFAYQWQSAATIGGTYTDISGATSAQYTIEGSQQGRFIRCMVTAFT